MNADLQKIRKSRFFKALPERAFERIISLIKVRAYEAGEEVFSLEKQNEFQNSYAYLVSGAVLFINENSFPLGLALKDEFFLTRSFTLNNEVINRSIAIDPRTFVVYIPRDILLLLAQSVSIYELIEDIYKSVFERSDAIRKDVNSAHEVQSWLKFKSYDKILSSWAEDIEKKRQAVLRQQEQEKIRDRKLKWIHGIAFAICSILIIWSRLYFRHHPAQGIGIFAFYATQIAFFCMIVCLVVEMLNLVFDTAPKRISTNQIKIENLEEELSKIHDAVPIKKMTSKEKLISYIKSDRSQKILSYIFYSLAFIQLTLTIFSII